MITVKVNNDKALELTNQYLDKLFECGISRPSSDAITPEEPIAKISACIHVASLIAVGITGNDYGDVGILHEALSNVIDKYLKLVGYHYVSDEAEENPEKPLDKSAT